MLVRRLAPGEHALLRALRLRALTDAPSAFGSTIERELAFTAETWEQRLRPEGHAQFVCEADDGIPIGIAAGARDASDPGSAYLLGLWVDPSARGSGAADALVTEVVRWAERERVGTLRLHVTEGNARAERLYLRHGFLATGSDFVRERDGAREIEMARPTA